MEKVATLQEIESFWSITDVAEANEMLDSVAAAQAQAQKNKG